MDFSPCDDLHRALLDGLAVGERAPASSHGASLSEELRAHVALCAVCRRAVRAWPLAARALTDLPRASAPRELDSAVVAARHAGVRTERAIRALQDLARLSPPREMADGLGSRERSETFPSEAARLGRAPLGRAPAPRVLDRLVEEELLDPAKARVRRHVGGLRRLSAPEGLASRVAAEIAHERRAFGPRHALRSLTVRRMRFVLGVAAVFVLLVLPMTLLPREAPGTGPVDLAPSRPFRVEQASSLGALTPISRGLLEAASSGLTRLDRG